MKIYTGGTFDLMHSGHVNFLRRCKDIAGVNGKVVVALNTDEFIFQYKKVRPVISYEERSAVLLGCRYVDEVVPNIGGKDSKQSIMLVNPDVIAIGTDWARKNYYEQIGFTQDWLDERNIILTYIPYTKNISTTEVKRRLREEAI